MSSEPLTDVVQPSKPTLTEAQLVRGGTQPESSCNDLGVISFKVQAEDPSPPGAEVGFVLDVAEGKLPSSLSLQPWPVVPSGNSTLSYPFPDDGQGSIDVTLRVRAVDKSGNLSDPIDVSFHDAGAGGCRMARGDGRGSLLTVGLVAVSLLARRRRRA